MESCENQLVREAENINQEILIELSGNAEITEHIVRSVDQNGCLFPHIVRHGARNRLNSKEVAIEDNVGLLHEHMRTVRDELKLSLDGLRKAKTQRLMQARNLTSNVAKQRPPYFVR